MKPRTIPLSSLQTQTTDYVPINPGRPIRTLKEVGEMLNLHPDRVKYLENLAFAKLRAALSAYGYNEDTP
jgi:hypothetical protein